MFSEAAFGSISKRMGVKPDRSYSDRSAVSTKSSASASLVRGGRGLGWAFIMRDFLLVHVAGADRPQLRLAVDLAELEHHEDMASRGRGPDGTHPRLLGKRISQDCRRPGEDLLDLGLGQAMLAAFGPVARVPIEACNLHASYLHLSIQT